MLRLHTRGRTAGGEKAEACVPGQSLPHPLTFSHPQGLPGAGAKGKVTWVPPESVAGHQTRPDLGQEAGGRELRGLTLRQQGLRSVLLLTSQLTLGKVTSQTCFLVHTMRATVRPSSKDHYEG